jgi:hypothetical protein
MSEHATAHRAGERFGAAVDASTDCHQVCVEAIAHGLQRRGEAAHLLHIRLLMDCATVCDATRDLALRSSDFAHQMFALCAEVCDRTAASCERLGGESFARCAQACRHCAKTCRELA